MIGVTLLLVLLAFAISIASALDPPWKAPLWVAVLLLAIVHLLMLLPR
jgi:hypothetical protein